MTLTNYKLKKERERFTLMEKGKAVSKGFLSKEAALHSVWTLNGKNPHHFYVEKDMIIYLEDSNTDKI